MQRRYVHFACVTLSREIIYRHSRTLKIYIYMWKVDLWSEEHKYLGWCLTYSCTSGSRCRDNIIVRYLNWSVGGQRSCLHNNTVGKHKPCRRFWICKTKQWKYCLFIHEMKTVPSAVELDDFPLPGEKWRDAKMRVEKLLFVCLTFLSSLMRLAPPGSAAQLHKLIAPRISVHASL